MRLAPAHQIVLFTLLSWLGEYLHNFFDLPHLTLLSPENSIPALISALLLLAWWLLPYKRATTMTLLAWVFVQLAGAMVSVIPFQFLPFYPAQTSFHYLMHVVYALAQFPLIITLRWQLRQMKPKQAILGVLP